MSPRIHNYTGEDLDVTWDDGRCIHVAECLRRLPTVFDNDRRPWVLPDHDTAENVAMTIMACPSGALHYTRKDGRGAEPIPAHNTIRLMRNGPLHIRGDITILNSMGKVILHDTRVALCRCGASANKPFCDNSHITAGFQAPVDKAPVATDDSPAIAETNQGGKLIIQATANGPLQITGNFTVLNRRGQRLFQGSDESFCRCGESSHKPHCDDSHRRSGFVAE